MSTEGLGGLIIEAFGGPRTVGTGWVGTGRVGNGNVAGLWERTAGWRNGKS